MRPVTLCLLLLVATAVTVSGQANKKKFGGSSGAKDKDYEAPASSDSDYEGQDESYYEDYEADKSSPSPKTTEKPKLTSPSSHDKDGSKGGPSLFGPRRTRKPFSPKPVERARATLPSFIRHPANPADLTTFKPVTSRPTAAPTTKAPSGGTTKSSVSVIRATTARSNRYKNSERSRPNTDNAANNDANRRFGGNTPRASTNKNNRSNYRQTGN